MSSLQESSYVTQEPADAQNGGNDYKDYYTLPSTNYTRIKGTKKYRKAQKRKKRQARRASIIRVYALIDELAEIGC